MMLAPRRWLVVIAAIFFLGIAPTLVWIRYDDFNTYRRRPSPALNKEPISNYNPNLVSFWNGLARVLLEDGKPRCPDLPNSGPGTEIEAPINKFKKIPPNFSFRPDLLHLPEEDVKELKSAHERYVSMISGLARQLPFKRSSKGIVTTASGSFLPVLAVSLRMLRRTGSSLPVEVFIETREVYEPEFCEEILPQLDAKCFILSEILGAVSVTIDPIKYQLKAFALLLSSFDDVLLLDADNLCMEQPEILMSSQPFISTGMVSWPDYWANTASPLYFTISSQPIPPVSQRASSESGQFLVSKSKHASTILLIIYYNVYGPSHYYPLLSQGAVGQGDKETYLAAAMALDKAYFAVYDGPQELEHTPGGDKGSGVRKGSGTLQVNPAEDYNVNAWPSAIPLPSPSNDVIDSPDPTNTAVRPTLPLTPPPVDKNEPLDIVPLTTNDTSAISLKKRESVFETTATNLPLNRQISFLHAQTYKLDPATFLLTWRKEIKTRMWGSAEEVEARFKGRDVEKEVWAEILWVACECQGRFRSWRQGTSKGVGKNVCKEAKSIYAELFG